ncbi:DUF1266 domain-containing protein [Amycolatopsis acidicola]|uniref:DUF1266 domain-containing protein n=1 Tax=Amycolatopsis acidicola TaxID=2596893 RepID=A0A5N0VBC3_9PSEU|nr:DUF1266 domain-containing protein [Amycolatopsis acidicola]KAA9161892.1 DUF1266 domain-containing protein [Amycolatopsis acidicola]
MAFLNDLRAQAGGMYWVIVIGVPLVVLVFVGQLVFKARGAAKRVRQFARSGKIVTSADHPVDGPLAFALACGAHMAVNQGVAWNDPTGSGHAKLGLRAELQKSWGVTGNADWRQTIESLLSESGDEADAVLEIRQRADDAVEWEKAIRQAAYGSQLGETETQQLIAAAERITRYEARFAKDGILAGGAVVTSTRAYDWGRAVNMARWGWRAGYCERAEAESAMLRAAALCAKHYSSWADLSAGYGLGRLLRFDDDEFAVWYSTVREPHEVLTTDPQSPWRTLPWQRAAVQS